MVVKPIDTGAAIGMALALRRMTQTDLAAAMGVHESRVSHLCKARNCTVETICRVADAIGMRASELIKLGEYTDGENSQRSPGTVD